jgi:hypothetical protein
MLSALDYSVLLNLQGYLLLLGLVCSKQALAPSLLASTNRNIAPRFL